MHWSAFVRRHPWIDLLLVVVLVAMAVAGWVLLRAPRSAAGLITGSMRPVAAQAEPPKTIPRGPPWLYGRADARFTVIGYADLECPYCRTYFPALKRWIDANPEVNWQWHHLPLAMHEPAASAGARLAECAGQAGGQAAFWQAVAWLYAHTRGDGQGLPPGLRYPGLTPAVQHCLDSNRPDAVIRAQVAQAAQGGIAATPTLQLRESKSGQILVLHGPVEGDALLSALDLLAAGTLEAAGNAANAAAAEPSHVTGMPADPVGDMPR